MSNRKSLVIVIALVAAATLLFRAGDATAAEEVNMHKLMKESPELVKWFTSLAARANLFRLTVAANASKGMPEVLKKFGTDDCRDRWGKVFQKYYNKQRLHIIDFFNSAIVFVGRADGKSGVVAFYNPWLDGLFITEWVGPTSEQKIKRMVLLSGDTFRGEKTPSNG